MEERGLSMVPEENDEEEEARMFIGGGWSINLLVW